jgi:diguanylate cyclase (GGDEF)-like protein/putative nucleotidyltransferase with HDIG domain
VLGKKHELAELEAKLAAAHQQINTLEEELRTRGLRDPVTGLSNLDAFERHLEAEVARCRRHKRALTLAIVDVDGFRAVNANHGRAAGDRVLAAVGAILDRFTRASDVVCRAGADEFRVMLPESAGWQAMECFERILLELEAADPAPLSCISVSVGVAVHSSRMTADQLVAMSGTALDRARAAGGGRVELSGQDEAAPGPSPKHSDAIAGLAEALLERDRYTGEHSESVVSLAASVARGLGLDEAEIERVQSAALLHDIGKVAIPDHILHNDGPLDDEEWKVMREHPVIGERILRAIPGMGGIARIVRHEHERFDGGGYPDGLAGEDIPIGSRIILACDAYHAMTSDRPYRQAMSHGAAIEEIAKCAGTQFDPKVTGMLIGSLYGRSNLIRRDPPAPVELGPVARPVTAARPN